MEINWIMQVPLSFHYFDDGLKIVYRLVHFATEYNPANLMEKVSLSSNHLYCSPILVNRLIMSFVATDDSVLSQVIWKDGILLACSLPIYLVEALEQFGYHSDEAPCLQFNCEI